MCEFGKLTVAVLVVGWVRIIDVLSGLRKEESLTAGKKIRESFTLHLLGSCKMFVFSGSVPDSRER